jgi:hypothetical protein
VSTLSVRNIGPYSNDRKLWPSLRVGSGTGRGSCFSRYFFILRYINNFLLHLSYKSFFVLIKISCSYLIYISKGHLVVCRTYSNDKDLANS